RRASPAISSQCLPSALSSQPSGGGSQLAGLTLISNRLARRRLPFWFKEISMNFSRHFYAVAGIIVVLSALSLGAGGKGAARTNPMPVNVINSTLNPVNTKAVGTTAVSGSVAVSGAVDVSGTVNIGN